MPLKRSQRSGGENEKEEKKKKNPFTYFLSLQFANEAVLRMVIIIG